ncbi:thiopurine S-methyltransferase-like [Ylistrum balloti]|uniref:thiopurine S-methyltransferase-like n=1 Tax=Ylistrum balloti TaxID=509963 RepID=UPI002905AC97|nr:thiopurine S-methyltransferase-like [Ylistrum balloti]
MSLLTKTSDVNGKKRINQFGDYDDTSNMTCTHWNDRWRKGQTQFHMPKVHPMLIKHIDRLTDGKTNLRFFVPLCGKTMDLNWLLERGHEVVGCDCSEEGCKEIFKRHNISYKTEYKANVRSTVLQGTDKKLSLYVGDYFDLQRKPDKRYLVSIEEDWSFLVKCWTGIRQHDKLTAEIEGK